MIWPLIGYSRLLPLKVNALESYSIFHRLTMEPQFSTRTHPSGSLLILMDVTCISAIADLKAAGMCILVTDEHDASIPLLNGKKSKVLYMIT